MRNPAEQPYIYVQANPHYTAEPEFAWRFGDSEYFGMVPQRTSHVVQKEEEEDIFAQNAIQISTLGLVVHTVSHTNFRHYQIANNPLLIDL